MHLLKPKYLLTLMHLLLHLLRLKLRLLHLSMLMHLPLHLLTLKLKLLR